MSLLLEGEAELLEQRAGLLVVLGRGHHGDVHTAHAVDRVGIDLVEDRLLGQPEGVVAVAVELLGAQAPEVADAREGDRDETVEELPHAVAPHGHVGADGLALAQLELGDGATRLGDLGLLTGDGRQVAHGALDHLRVVGGLAHTHVDDDLDHAGDLHHVGVVELLAKGRLDLVQVDGLQAGGDLLSHGHRSSPDFLA